MCNGQQSRNLTANNQILKKTTALGTRNTTKKRITPGYDTGALQ